MKKVTLSASAFFTAIALFFAATSCKKTDSPVVQTLYDSLGGTTMVTDPKATGAMIEKGRLGIRSVVDSTIFVIAADAQLNGYFQTLLAEVGAGNTSGFSALSKNLTDFLCVGTGAKNFAYGGKSMAASHDPAQNARMKMKADNAAMDRFITDVVAGANKNALPTYLITRVGAVLETLRSQVVQR